MLWRLLLLVAVLLMPLGMQPAAASSSAPHHAASMPMQHCPGQAPRHDGGGFPECAMACSAALPAIEIAVGQGPVIRSKLDIPTAQQALHGLHPETATPPPKLS